MKENTEEFTENNESWKEAKEAMDKAYSELQECVRENPTESILVALGAGIILGLLLRK